MTAGCSICDDGAKSLAEALRESNALDTLELPCCGVGAAGALALATALDESNYNLTSLDLRGEACHMYVESYPLQRRQGFNLAMCPFPVKLGTVLRPTTAYLMKRVKGLSTEDQGFRFRQIPIYAIQPVIRLHAI